MGWGCGLIREGWVGDVIDFHTQAQGEVRDMDKAGRRGWGQGLGSPPLPTPIAIPGHRVPLSLTI